MERIFKRSQKNKEIYFGAELYAWPLMFFPTFRCYYRDKYIL